MKHDEELLSWHASRTELLVPPMRQDLLDVLVTTLDNRLYAALRALEYERSSAAEDNIRAARKLLAAVPTEYRPTPAAKAKTHRRLMLAYGVPDNGNEA